MSYKFRTRRTALHLTAMAVVLGGALLLNHNAASPQARLDPSSGLLVTSRDSFQMCVHTVPALRTDGSAIRAQLAGALERVGRHPDWTDAFGGHLAPAAPSAAITPGCPGARLPEEYRKAKTVAGPGRTKSPSPYRTWVYVLDQATANDLLGPDVNAVTAPAELMKSSDHQFATVSTALLVRRSYLNSPGCVTRELTRAVGLKATPNSHRPDTCD